MDEPKKQTIKCGKCGTEFAVHAPVITIKPSDYVTLYTITPTWSTDERICRGCRTMYAPLLPPNAVDGPIVWAAISEKKDAPKIAIPSLVLPDNFNPKRG